MLDSLATSNVSNQANIKQSTIDVSLNALAMPSNSAPTVF